VNRDIRKEINYDEGWMDVRPIGKAQQEKKIIKSIYLIKGVL
jgi:hypothetical protein